MELWTPNGSGGFTYENLGTVSTSWQIAGTGDFAGSGEGILWRNWSTGAVELWSPNGSGGFAYEALNPVSTAWQVAGTGDFTGSGEDGIFGATRQLAASSFGIRTARAASPTKA